jgi:hypothetical protein
MDRAYLFNRVKALQREIAEIARHNRQYFGRKHHSSKDQAQYQEMRQRIYQIRAELYALIEGTTA